MRAGQRGMPIPVMDRIYRRFQPLIAIDGAEIFRTELVRRPDRPVRADVPLVVADGGSVSLLSYRGKPVLLDFWATWCQPCVASLPKLAELAKEAAPKGMVLLSVDEDHEEKRATDFLAKQNYTWPNTHDDGSIHRFFNRLGIPLVVLIDENGKIVFWGSDEDDYDLRMAIAALGPQYASLAPAPKPQDACEIGSRLPPIN